MGNLRGFEKDRKGYEWQSLPLFRWHALLLILMPMSGNSLLNWFTNPRFTGRDHAVYATVTGLRREFVRSTAAPSTRPFGAGRILPPR